MEDSIRILNPTKGKFLKDDRGIQQMARSFIYEDLTLERNWNQGKIVDGLVLKPLLFIIIFQTIKKNLRLVTLEYSSMPMTLFLRSKMSGKQEDWNLRASELI